jgi:hypothetical protein
MSSGKFRVSDPTIATLAFLGMCNWSYKWYAPKADEITPERMAKLLCQVFLEGLNSPASTKDGTPHAMKRGHFPPALDISRT